VVVVVGIVIVVVVFGVVVVVVVAVELMAQSMPVPDCMPLVETYLHPFTVLTEIQIDKQLTNMIKFISVIEMLLGF
jgi:hypothetical protein